MPRVKPCELECLHEFEKLFEHAWVCLRKEILRLKAFPNSVSPVQVQMHETQRCFLRKLSSDLNVIHSTYNTRLFRSTKRTKIPKSLTLQLDKSLSLNRFFNPVMLQHPFHKKKIRICSPLYEPWGER